MIGRCSFEGRNRFIDDWRAGSALTNAHACSDGLFYGIGCCAAILNRGFNLPHGDVLATTDNGFVGDGPYNLVRDCMLRIEVLAEAQMPLAHLF